MVPNQTIDVIADNGSGASVAIPPAAVPKVAAALETLFSRVVEMDEYPLQMTLRIVSARTGSIEFRFGPTYNVTVNHNLAQPRTIDDPLSTGADLLTIVSIVCGFLFAGAPHTLEAPSSNEEQFARKAAAHHIVKASADELVKACLLLETDTVRIRFPDGREISVVSSDAKLAGIIASRPTDPFPVNEPHSVFEGKVQILDGPIETELQFEDNPGGSLRRLQAYLARTDWKGSHTVVLLWDSKAPAPNPGHEEGLTARGRFVNPRQVTPLSPPGTRYRDADAIIHVQAISGWL